MFGNNHLLLKEFRYNLKQNNNSKINNNLNNPDLSSLIRTYPYQILEVKTIEEWFLDTDPKVLKKLFDYPQIREQSNLEEQEIESILRQVNKIDKFKQQKRDDKIKSFLFPIGGTFLFLFFIDTALFVISPFIAMFTIFKTISSIDNIAKNNEQKDQATQALTQTLYRHRMRFNRPENRVEASYMSQDAQLGEPLNVEPPAYGPIGAPPPAYAPIPSAPPASIDAYEHPSHLAQTATVPGGLAFRR